MCAHWEEVGPPVHLSVAAYLGLGKKVSTEGKKSPANVGDDPAQLWNELSASGGMIQ